MYEASRAGMSPTGSTQSTMPVAIAERGMPECSASSGILGDRQAAALLDALDADRAVAVGAREDDRRRGVRAVRVGEGAEEQVDGDAAAALGARGRSQARWPFADDSVLPGGMT